MGEVDKLNPGDDADAPVGDMSEEEKTPDLGTVLVERTPCPLVILLGDTDCEDERGLEDPPVARTGPAAWLPELASVRPERWAHLFALEVEVSIGVLVLAFPQALWLCEVGFLGGAGLQCPRGVGEDAFSSSS